MKLDDIVDLIARAWTVLSPAPVLFVSGLIAAVLLVWRLFEWRYGGVIALKDMQLDDYKTKLAGATPEEARARIDQLEEKLFALLPRTLSSVSQS